MGGYGSRAMTGIFIRFPTYPMRTAGNMNHCTDPLGSVALFEPFLPLVPRAMLRMGFVRAFILTLTGTERGTSRQKHTASRLFTEGWGSSFFSNENSLGRHRARAPQQLRNCRVLAPPVPSP